MTWIQSKKARVMWYAIGFILCLSAGLVVSKRSSQPASATVIAHKIALDLHRETEKLEADAVRILEGLAQDPEYQLSSTTGYQFFVYYDLSLIAWSDNTFIPPGRQVSAPFTYHLLKTSNGDYLARKWEMSDRKFLLALVPLRKHYVISNDYLEDQWNDRIFSEPAVEILEPGSNLGEPVCIGDVCPFKINVNAAEWRAHEKSRWTAVILLSLALVAFLLLFFAGLRRVRRRYPDWGFVYLTLGLYTLRMIMVYSGYPFGLVSSMLFDPQGFASSQLNRSLGDLALNSLAMLICCYYLFSNYYRFRLFRYLNKTKWSSLAFGVFCSVAILFAALYPFIVVQTINNNSSIILDISRSLTFDSLRVTAFVCIAIAWACSFLFMHVFLRMLAAQRPARNVWICMLAGVTVFVGINLLTRQIFVSSLLVGVAFFLVTHAFRLYASLRRIGYTTFSYLFFAILFLALNGAYAVQSFSRKDKIDNQFRFASNFLIDRDYFGEYLLNGLAHKISEDAFIQSRMASPFLGKDAIRQKIRQVFLPSYFNKYDVEILLFTGAGMPMGNTAPYTFTELIGAYRREAFKTDYEGVYYVTSPSADVTQRYLVYAPMHRGQLNSGYIFLVMSLKRVIPENVYPELLVDHRFQQFYRTRDLSYAVFSGRNLVFSSGEFNYELFFDRTWLSDARLRSKGLSRSGFDHIAVADENGRVAVVSSPTKSWLFILSNFSNLLVLGLSVILLVLLIVGLLNYVRGRKLFFSARIQLYLNLAFFLPLIVVSITTLSLTSVSSQEQLKTEYLNKSRNFGSHLVSLLSAYIETRTDTTIDFENELTDLAKLSNLDANVFTQQGSLIASSQPLIYTNGLLSTHINPEALHRIRHGESSFITTEQVGRLNYFVSYLALRSPQSGRLIGILGIPFFQSVYSLEKVQITILANILTIFAVIFIVLLVLSFFVSRWLTFPLKFITQTLSRTSLTKINQPLTWRSDDEIGLMVKEYNQMLYKLGESKAELEQTQRELAWREIAQQVAHEIKNPLTPMKLTLQQLERAVQTGNNSEEKTTKALASLLTQVDTLNDIASSFSAFAKMPEPIIQRFDLVSLLRRIVNLHSQSGTIHFRPTPREMPALGDEQLLGRIFSNMIINAFQAARPGVPLVVDIVCEKVNDKCRVSIRDNGKGISEALAERVFVPHFTTKKSGSGLGLAISRQGVEHMGGQIWFESRHGEGTTFFIELPPAEV